MSNKIDILNRVASEGERLSGKYDAMTIGIAMDEYAKIVNGEQCKASALNGYMEGFKSAILSLEESLPMVEKTLFGKTS